MSGLLTRLGNIIRSNLHLGSSDQTVIVIGDRLYNEVVKLFDLTVSNKYINNVNVYGNIDVDIETEIERDAIESYTELLLNVVFELTACLNFDYKKYLEYQNKQIDEVGILNMFTEEFREAAVSKRNMLTKNTVNGYDIDLNNAYIEVESKILKNLDNIVRLICNKYNYISRNNYLIPYEWISDKHLLCVIVERR